jgi:hypothetical protein
MTKRKMNLNMTPTIMVTMTTIGERFSPGRAKKESAYCTATTSAATTARTVCRSSSEGGTCKDDTSMPLQSPLSQSQSVHPVVLVKLRKKKGRRRTPATVSAAVVVTAK